MSQTAFVTGASGFVGAALVRELHQQNWDIHVLARPTSSLEEIEDLPVTVHTGDVVEAESLRGAVPEGVDAVFHVAASTNFWSRNNAVQSRINIDGTRHVLEAAAAAGAGRFIQTSSFITWGVQDKVINEETPRVDTFDWINYIRTKHLSEQLVLDAVERGRVDAVILNPANILGPGDWRNWSRLFLMIHRNRLPAAPSGGGSFCDVREVAKAHIRAYHAAPAGEKYLLGGEYSTLLDVIRIAGETLDKPVPSRAAPAWLFKAWAHFTTGLSLVTGREPEFTPETAAMSAHEIVCDSSKAQRELGYAFTPVPDLVRDTIEWMERKGLLS